MITYIDAVLAAWLLPVPRTMLWAAISAAVSMGLYALLSPQEKIRALRIQHKEARKKLMHYDGDFSGLWPIISQDLTLSFKQLGLNIIPFAAALAPIIWLMDGLGEIYAQTTYIDAGPEWMHGFEFFYIVILMICSLIIKFVFKIS